MFGGQVVGQEDESPRENVVVEEEAEKERARASKGKGKATAAPRAPGAKRPRLLLEDVKGRENSSSNETTSEMFDLDDEEIEEIQRPMDEDNLPNSSSGASPFCMAGALEADSVRSGSQYPTLPSLTRTNSSGGKAFGYPSPSKADTNSSRFTTLPSTAPTPQPSGPSPPPTSAAPETQYHLPPDYLASLLSGGNSPATLEALFQLQNGGGLNTSGAPASASTSASPLPGPTPDFSGFNGTPAPVNGNSDYFYRALLPSPKPAAQMAPATGAGGMQPNPLEGLISPSALATIFPSADSALTSSYGQQLEENTEQLEDALSEKADIDQRTTALESAIAKLMQALPAETRDQLSGSGQSSSAAPFAPGLGLDGGSQGGSPWDPSNQVLSDADLESLLAQYGERHCLRWVETLLILSPAVNNPNPTDTTNGSWDDPFEPGSALGINPSGTFEQLSPSDSMRDSFSNSDGLSTVASTPGANDDLDDDDYDGDGSAPGAKRGKKRKSAAMETAPSPAPSEGTRRSARQRR